MSSTPQPSEPVEEHDVRTIPLNTLKKWMKSLGYSHRLERRRNNNGDSVIYYWLSTDGMTVLTDHAALDFYERAHRVQNQQIAILRQALEKLKIARFHQVWCNYVPPIAPTNASCDCGAEGFNKAIDYARTTIQTLITGLESKSER